MLCSIVTLRKLKTKKQTNGDNASVQVRDPSPQDVSLWQSALDRDNQGTAVFNIYHTEESSHLFCGNTSTIIFK